MNRVRDARRDTALGYAVAVQRSHIAIDQVSFHQNTTPVPDEMLAHRLGMVPLISRNVAQGLRYTRVSRSGSIYYRTYILGLCPRSVGIARSAYLAYLNQAALSMRRVSFNGTR